MTLEDAKNYITSRLPEFEGTDEYIEDFVGKTEFTDGKELALALIEKVEEVESGACDQQEIEFLNSKYSTLLDQLIAINKKRRYDRECRRKLSNSDPYYNPDLSVPGQEKYSDLVIDVVSVFLEFIKRNDV